MKGSRLLGLSMCVLLSGWAIPLRTATATLSPLASAGESVVFSDDFDNGNSNVWSNIGSSAGQATIGADPSVAGVNVWYPNSLSAITTSAVTLPNSITLDATVSQIDVYMRVRDTAYNVASGTNTFNIRLMTDAGATAYARMVEYPVTSTQIVYRNLAGANTTATGTGFTAASAITFVDYRLEMNFVAGSPNTMSLMASRYNGTSYVNLFASPVTSAKLDTGVFTILDITSRSGATDQRAYFDSVQISVVPEPATLALLALGGGLFLQRRRQGA